MDKKIAISQLERLFDEIPRLENLLPKNSEFPNWNNRVKDIIKKTWGNNSKEYNLYDGVLLLKIINFDNRQTDMKQAYLDTLNQRKTALKAIIEEHKKSIFDKIWYYFIDLWRETIAGVIKGKSV